MWSAARAYTEKYERLMAKVVAGSADIKCVYTNNNLAKCWNAWIKHLKDLPLDSLVDVISIKTMVLFEKRRKISLALTGVILPAIIHQLNATSKGLDHLQVTKGNPQEAKVTDVQG